MEATMMRDTNKLMMKLYEDREPIIEACKKVQITKKVKNKDNQMVYETTTIDNPCQRIDGDLCAACAFPTKKWRMNICNLATHLHVETKKGEPDVMTTPIEPETGRSCFLPAHGVPLRSCCLCRATSLHRLPFLQAFPSKLKRLVVFKNSWPEHWIPGGHF